MKTLNLKLAGVVAFSLLSISSFAQINWQKGGNGNFPFFAQPIIGTNATWNAPLNFVTNGVQRVKIMPFGTTNADGRVAIGNNLAAGFIPQVRLHLHHDDGSRVFFAVYQQ